MKEYGLDGSQTMHYCRWTVPDEKSGEEFERPLIEKRHSPYRPIVRSLADLYTGQSSSPFTRPRRGAVGWIDSELDGWMDPPRPASSG
jgi:hypothetical protein